MLQQSVGISCCTDRIHATGHHSIQFVSEIVQLLSDCCMQLRSSLDIVVGLTRILGNRFQITLAIKNRVSSSLILIQCTTRCGTSRGRIFGPTLIILSHLFGTSVPSQHQNCFSKSFKFWIHSEHALRSSSTHRASRSRATESEWNGPVVCLPGPGVVILLLLESQVLGEPFDAVSFQQ